MYDVGYISDFSVVVDVSNCNVAEPEIIKKWFEEEWKSRICKPFFLSCKHLIIKYDGAIIANPDLVSCLVICGDLERDYELLSYHIGLTVDMLNSLPKSCWSWYYISHNPGITMQDIINHPEYQWDWNGASHNPNLI